MAKNKQQTTDEPIALDVQLSKGEAFIEKNWKKIAIVLGAVIVIVAGIYAYKHYMMIPKATQYPWRHKRLLSAHRLLLLNSSMTKR